MRGVWWEEIVDVGGRRGLTRPRTLAEIGDVEGEPQSTCQVDSLYLLERLFRALENYSGGVSRS